MDDGLGRPGCMAGSESECYNRAIECARARARATAVARPRRGRVKLKGPASLSLSAARRYALDHDGDGSGIARAVWQFSYPDEFSEGESASSARAASYADVNSKIGNSVSKLPNDHYAVAFTVLDNDSSRASSSQQYADLCDVDADGALHALLRVHNVSFFGDGSYRALPYESVYGETRACPLG